MTLRYCGHNWKIGDEYEPGTKPNPCQVVGIRLNHKNSFVLSDIIMMGRFIGRAEEGFYVVVTEDNEYQISYCIFQATDLGEWSQSKKRELQSFGSEYEPLVDKGPNDDGGDVGYHIEERMVQQDIVVIHT